MLLQCVVVLLYCCCLCCCCCVPAFLPRQCPDSVSRCPWFQVDRVHRCTQDTADSPYRTHLCNRGWESSGNEAHGNLQRRGEGLASIRSSGVQQLFVSIRTRSVRLTTNLTLQDGVSDQGHLLHLRMRGPVNTQVRVPLYCSVCLTCSLVSSLSHLSSDVQSVSPVLWCPVCLTCPQMSCLSNLS